MIEVDRLVSQCFLLAGDEPLFLPAADIPEIFACKQPIFFQHDLFFITEPL